MLGKQSPRATAGPRAIPCTKRPLGSPVILGLGLLPPQSLLSPGAPTGKQPGAKDPIFPQPLSPQNKWGWRGGKRAGAVVGIALDSGLILGSPSSNVHFTVGTPEKEMGGPWRKVFFTCRGGQRTAMSLQCHQDPAPTPWPMVSVGWWPASDCVHHQPPPWTYFQPGVLSPLIVTLSFLKSNSKQV